MHPTETWLHECHQASQAISSWQGCFIWTFPIGIISDTDFRINGAAQFVVCYQGTSIMHRSATFLWCIYQVHNPHYPIYHSSYPTCYNDRYTISYWLSTLVRLTPLESGRFYFGYAPFCAKGCRWNIKRTEFDSSSACNSGCRSWGRTKFTTFREWGTSRYTNRQWQDTIFLTDALINWATSSK